MKALAKDLKKVVDSAYETFQDDLDWDFKPGPEKWSGKQILGHLIDSAYNNIQRFIRGAYEEDFKIAYQQNEWVRFQHYDKADIKEIVQLWVLLNKQIVRIWENYPQERATVKSDVGHTVQEFLTIQEIATSYNDHLKHHLKQIYRVTSSNFNDSTN